MNILNKYKIELYTYEEFIKLDKYITIGTFEECFYFKNDMNINSDFGYAALLELDIRAYRKLIYSNINYKEDKNCTTYLFLNEKEARKKKKLLLILLLERYKNLETIKLKMEYLLYTKK